MVRKFILFQVLFFVLLYLTGCNPFFVKRIIPERGRVDGVYQKKNFTTELNAAGEVSVREEGAATHIESYMSWNYSTETGQGTIYFRAENQNKWDIDYEIPFNYNQLEEQDSDYVFVGYAEGELSTRVTLKVIFPTEDNGAGLHRQIRISFDKVTDRNGSEVTDSYELGSFRDIHAIEYDRASNPTGRNISDEYHHVWDDIDSSFSPAVLARLQRDYTLVFVPGFLSDIVINMKETLDQFSESDDFYRFIKKFGDLTHVQVTRLGEYFDEQLSWLETSQIAATRVKTNGQGTPEENIADIRNAISFAAGQGKKVILLGHSKGGIDSLYTLLNEPEIRGHVAGFIPLQSPLMGSPVAGWVHHNVILGPVARYLLEELNGTEEALRSLLVPTRISYYRTNEKKIAYVLDQVPTISYASYKMSEPLKPIDSLLWFLRDPLEENHGLNDGLVQLESAIYPNTDYITERGVDHAVSVMYCSFIDFDRVRFLKTLLVLMLQKIDGNL